MNTKNNLDGENNLDFEEVVNISTNKRFKIKTITYPSTFIL